MNVIEKQFNNATDALNNLQSCLEEVSMLICQEQNITCNIRWLPLHDSFASFLSKDRRKEYTKVLKWQRSFSTYTIYATFASDSKGKYIEKTCSFLTQEGEEFLNKIKKNKEEGNNTV